MDDCKIIGLTLYPVKGCQGIPLDQAMALDKGLAIRLANGQLLQDRQYMIVDENGNFMTQREVSAMATISVNTTPTGLKLSTHTGPRPIDELTISHLEDRSADGLKERPTTVWAFEGHAWDLGDEARQWLSSVLQRPASLVQFSESAPRACKDIGKPIAHTFFADSFPYLLLNQQSVTDLQARLQAQHQDSSILLPSNRFRSNILLDGLPAYDEDLLDTVESSRMKLQVLSKCVRCNVPAIDQFTGQTQTVSPTALLDTYRLDQTLGGSTLGVNAMLSGIHPEETVIRVGDALTVEYAF